MNKKKQDIDIEKGDNDSFLLRFFLVIFVFKCMIPIFLLLSGIVILVIRIPGWSLLLGLPLVVLGTVFTVYTYDGLVGQGLGDYKKDISNCQVCRKPTPVFKGQDKNKIVCPVCANIE